MLSAEEKWLFTFDSEDTCIEFAKIIKGEVCSADAVDVKISTPTFCPSLILPDNIKSSVWEEAAQEIFEWIGIISLKGANPIEAQPEHISLYGMDSDNVLPSLCSRTCIGLICSETIKKIFETTQTQPWRVLIVHGFEDSPVSWKGQEHGYGQSGENGYVIYDHEINGCLLWEITSTLDQH